MRFCVSNIAWTQPERLQAYALLQSQGFTGLEIAPGIFFATEPDAFQPSAQALQTAMAEVADAGLRLTSMQALLFGVQGAALFGDQSARETFTAAMLRAIALAGRLRIASLVFGSPKQRIVPADMPPADALNIAAETFRHLGDAAAAQGCKIAIEPNPAAYGTNFLNRQSEVETFLDQTAHPAICGIIDAGALAMNAETPVVNLPRIAHVHCSAPELAPVTRQDAHRLLAQLLALGYAGPVSIEMKRGPNGMTDLHHSVTALATEARALGLMGQP